MVKRDKFVETATLLLALFFVSLSCSTEVADTPVSNAGESLEGSVLVSSATTTSSSLLETSTSTLPSSTENAEATDESSPSSPVTSLAEVPESGYKPVAMERRPVSYLEEVVSPCLPVDGLEQDPCQGSPVLLAGVSSFVGWVLDELPAFDDIMLGKLLGEHVPAVAPHIVIRGLVQPDTTRCELYWVEAFSYRNLPPAGYAYFCFAEVSIHEYIVGEGPAQLTVAMHREPVMLYPEQAADWPNTREWMVPEVLGDPQARTAASYEGKEMVLFLRIPIAMALESWARSGWWGNTWFLQRTEEGEIRALEQDYNIANTDELRNQLNLPLSELVARIKEAEENRAVVTEGRIGLDSTLPLLVTDANQLQDFYVSAGAVYEGDDAPVLPPPVPGGDEPEHDPTQTGAEEPDPAPPAPGEEETAPPLADDATTTTTSATQPQTDDTTVSSTTSTTTTTTQPQTEDTTPTAAETTLPQSGDDIPTSTETTLPPDNSGSTVPAVDEGTRTGTG